MAASLSDLQVFNEYAYSSATEVLRQQIELFNAIDMNGFDVTNTGYAAPLADDIKVAFDIDEPYASYYGGGIFDSEISRQVGALGQPSLPSHIVFDSAWDTANPYAGDGWACRSFLYRDTQAAGVTKTLRLVVSWSAALKTAIIPTIKRGPIRLVDPAGVAATLDVRALKVYVRDGDLSDTASTDFMQDTDLVIELDTEVSTSVAWTVSLLTAWDMPEGYCSVWKAAPTTPWRGWADLPLDVAPGDQLYLDDGQSAIVWHTSGDHLYLVPPLQCSAPEDTYSAYRTRYLAPGARVVRLSDDDAEHGIWRVQSLTYTDGITLKGVAGIALSLGAGTHYLTPLVNIPEMASTKRFEVLDSLTDTLVDLESQEQQFRRALAKTLGLQEGQIAPLSWFLRAGGAVQRADRMGRAQVYTESLSRPLPGVPVEV